MRANVSAYLRPTPELNQLTTMKATHSSHSASSRPWPGIVRLALALLLLNGVLSFTSWWPTVAVLPDARIAPEAIAAWLLLSGWLVWRGQPSPRALDVAAALYALLVLGRYLDVVAPSLFGRPISLYWDVPQLPRFLWVTASGSPWWATVLVLVVTALVVWAFHRLLVKAMRMAAEGAAPLVRHPALWVLNFLLASLAIANTAGVEATWPYVSKPVIPTYARELKLLVDARSPDRVAALLPATTVVDEALNIPSDQVLGALSHRDLMLVFLESFGAVLYDRPEAVAATADTRSALEQSMRESGRGVVSAFYTSPTIGGASDLAHLSVLSGIDLSDPRRHDLLLTTQRPTLLGVFRHAGYEVFGLYHSVWWEWAERAYYGFDVYLSGPDLGYAGPSFGYWHIPDQYAFARFEQLHPRTSERRPRMTVFGTISTHFPFVPVPPYQRDWQRLLGNDPFDADDVARAQAEQIDWMNMTPAYLKTINYANTWLADYFRQPEPRDTVFLMIGDHQPTSNVSGEGASWDVPVYVVSRDPVLLARFRALGFSDGMKPQRRSLGGLHDLTGTVLRALGPAPLPAH
jgi:hypothetical protein